MSWTDVWFKDNPNMVESRCYAIDNFIFLLKKTNIKFPQKLEKLAL